MPNLSASAWPEAFVSDRSISQNVSRDVRQGNLRKLASRLYTTNLTEAPEKIVRRNLWTLVAGYFPGALIADRTALENAPAADGSICLIVEKERDAVVLPGITLRPRKGVAALPSDRPFIGGLYLSSTARAFLENMRPSRARSGLVTRTLSHREMEERLEVFIRRSGETAAGKLRDDIRTIAKALNMEQEAKQLDELIGTLLGTRDAPVTSAVGKARKMGMAYDPERLPLFEALHGALRATPPSLRMARDRTPEGLATLAFYEAYFSNFIEGTEFEVQEAADIVFNGHIPAERPQDAHDVLGTYRIVSDMAEMRRIPDTLEQFLTLLRSRHMAIMQSRPDKHPGQFKSVSNRAGATTFVAPELVQGTLAHGYEMYRSLDAPLHRAVFMMFLVAEVHPFADGNGRVARVMMNAELIAAGEERIVIPTIYRNNYLVALKALSQTGEAQPFIRMLEFAQAYTQAVEWSDVERSRGVLSATNAFADPHEADTQGIRLKMPGV